jgi:uncharacterized protein (DUF2141 family)
MIVPAQKDKTLRTMGTLLGCAVLLAAGSAHAEDEAARQAACRQAPYSIMINLKNVRDDRGTITIDLHGDNPETFLKSGAKLSRTRVPAVQGDMDICLPVEKPGVYAVGLYHDRDSDQKLDKNFLGIPSEPFGVSRDAPIRLAAPKHHEAAFEVKGPLTPVTVTMGRKPSRSRQR